MLVFPGFFWAIDETNNNYNSITTLCRKDYYFSLTVATHGIKIALVCKYYLIITTFASIRCRPTQLQITMVYDYD